MPNEEQLKLLNRNVEEWNQWRSENPEEKIDLGSANLFQANLAGADLHDADLRRSNLRKVDLSAANLTGAQLYRSNLNGVNLQNADLEGADLYRSYLGRADLSGANLKSTNLQMTILSQTIMEGANLQNAKVYGISTWNLEGEPADQTDLIITPDDETIVTVDSIKLAQFMYLLLSNEEVREVIDTITSKVVLILGRFNKERKLILDALRDKLREEDLTPVLMDCDVPDNRDITESITLLARMSRYIIADLTDPKSVPQELQAIIPDVMVPVRPIILEGQEPWSMFRDLKRKYHWVLNPYEYSDVDTLIASLQDVITPAEEKRIELSLY